MKYETKVYTVITGASSGIGYETAKAFAVRGKNLVVVARRKDCLKALKNEILEKCPTVDVIIKTVDLSVLENVYQFYSSLQGLRLETWVNNAGFGNYGSVAQQDLGKIDTMIRLNIEALIFYRPCLFMTIRTFPKHSLSTFLLVADTRLFLLPLPIVQQNSTSAHLRRDWLGN